MGPIGGGGPCVGMWTSSSHTLMVALTWACSLYCCSLAGNQVVCVCHCVCVCVCVSLCVCVSELHAFIHICACGVIWKGGAGACVCVFLLGSSFLFLYCLSSCRVILSVSMASYIHVHV